MRLEGCPPCSCARGRSAAFQAAPLPLAGEVVAYIPALENFERAFTLDK